MSRGFTLLEALVVLAIAAVLAGLGGTTLMNALPGTEMDRAARTIVAMSRYARFEAIKRNDRIRFQCDADRNACEIRVRSDNTLLRRFELSSLRNNVAAAKTFTTHFNGQGRATAAGKITLENGTGQSRTVTVRLSGSVVSE